MKKTIYYNIKNGGDGSYYPYFFESEAICDLDYEYPLYEDDNWMGERCSGSLDIEAYGEIKVRDITTLDEIIKEAEENIKCDIECFPNNDYPEQREGWQKRLDKAIELKTGK
jgi:hypothetical protein